MAINIVGVSGKFFSSLGKIVVCPENFFDSQNGGGGGGGGGRRKKFLSRGPKVAEKGPRHKICLRVPCSSVTLLRTINVILCLDLNKYLPLKRGWFIGESKIRRNTFSSRTRDTKAKLSIL